MPRRAPGCRASPIGCAILNCWPQSPEGGPLSGSGQDALRRGLEAPDHPGRIVTTSLPQVLDRLEVVRAGSASLTLIPRQATHQRVVLQLDQAAGRCGRAVQFGIDVARAGGRRVDEEPPGKAAGDLGDDELLRLLAARVEHDQHVVVGRIERVAARGRAEKMHVRLWPPLPQSTGPPAGSYQLTSGRSPGRDRQAGEEVGAADGGLRPAEGDQRLAEADQVLVLLDQPPVEPGDGVVLAVGVVVALLGAAALVAEQEHGHALARAASRPACS